MYKICLSPLPILREYYEIERNTVWQCADTHNILVYIHEGSCVFRLDEMTLRAGQGDVIFIPANRSYVRSAVDGRMCRFSYLHFDTAVPIEEVGQAEETAAPFEKYVLVQQKVSMKHYGGAFCDIMKRLFDERYSHVSMDDTFASAYLCQLIATAAQEVFVTADHITAITMDSREVSGIYPKPLRDAIYYIRSHVNEKINVTEMSRICGITPQHMVRLFRKHLNQTTVSFINRAKMMRAIELLRSSELSIQEIAYALGFDNPNYFTRVFAKAVGVPPTERREQIMTYERARISV